jgi:hypothetical protein
MISDAEAVRLSTNKKSLVLVSLPIFYEEKNMNATSISEMKDRVIKVNGKKKERVIIRDV